MLAVVVVNRGRQVSFGMNGILQERGVGARFARAESQRSDLFKQPAARGIREPTAVTHDAACLF